MRAGGLVGTVFALTTLAACAAASSPPGVSAGAALFPGWTPSEAPLSLFG